MKLIVEGKSQYGIKSNGQWYNPSKFHKNVSLDGLNVGDEVEVEIANDKYITSLTKVNSGEDNQTPSRSTESSNVGRPTESSRRNDPQTRLEIARMNANTAIWGSPLVAALLQSVDFSEAVSEINALIDATVSFTLTGNRSVLTIEKQETK